MEVARMNGRIAVLVPTTWGVSAFGLLLAAYFALLTGISGWKFTVSQFAEFWFYILPLAAGFGVQVALYARLKQVIRRAAGSRRVLAASGTTSTAAMASCCTHYLVNVAPVLGAAGLVAFAAQYQVELFWVGLAFNAAGIVFIARRLFKVSKERSSHGHADDRRDHSQ
jgi:Cu+-exporting ATPase